MSQANSTPAFQNGNRSSTASVETGLIAALKFDERGLIPVTTTCAEHGGLLMQAWMNADAFTRTVETGQAHYWSRSRSQLWHKGATSGELQHIVDIRTDCDQDSLWLIVRQDGGGCCHVGHPSCFYRRVSKSQIGQPLSGGTVALEMVD